MPVEEGGNMVILAAAITKIEGKTDYAKKYWDLLTTWTNYLADNGQDPSNQLCTDDFAGHWAHNANLSIKAILGVAGYSEMARMLGMNDVADKYAAIAKNMNLILPYAGNIRNIKLIPPYIMQNSMSPPQRN